MVRKEKKCKWEKLGEKKEEAKKKDLQLYKIHKPGNYRHHGRMVNSVLNTQQQAKPEWKPE